MRILLMGDIHGNLEALETCFAVAGEESVDRINVLGDIVGYMANPNECVYAVKNYDCIAGNHDIAAFDDDELSQFNPFAYKALLWTRNCLKPENLDFLKSLPPHRVYCDEDYTIAHGSLINPFAYTETESQVRLNTKFMPTSLLFIGHTHVPAMWCAHNKPSVLGHSRSTVIELEIEYNKEIPLLKDKKYVINIGSIGQPRDLNPKSCCLVYDTKSYSVKFLRFDYPVDITIQKIKENNLPEFLHFRLLKGE